RLLEVSSHRSIQILLELSQQLPVELALEGDDQLRELLRIDPFPLAELGVLRVDVHVLIGAEEARQIPILVLPDILPAPELAAQPLGQVILQTFRALADARDEARLDARFLLELAQCRRPRLFVSIDPALRHLPRFVGIIDARPDEDLALAVEEHDADSAAVAVIMVHGASSQVGASSANARAAR